MADEQELFRQVSEAIRTVLPARNDAITPESRFRRDLGAESIDVLDISFEIEKLTGVELDFETVINHVKALGGTEVSDLSVGDLVGYLAHVKAGA